MKTGLAIALLLLAASAITAEPLSVKDGDRIAFLGDSITQGGMGNPNGYCRLVISGLLANGIKAEPIGAGISGHKSNQMLARLEKDVLAHKPDWMTLSCGVNDVWHGAKGIELPDYRKNITEIVDKAQKAGIKVMILTSTMIKEDAENELNKKLQGYNDFLRELAKEKKCLLADLNADMQAKIAELKKAGPPADGKNYLTSDGVHMAVAGNQLMAAGVLKAFGLADAQLEKARLAWAGK